MNVTILCSSSDKIDDYYLSIARSISGYLASSDFDLVFGSSSKSMMGICYQEFRKYGRNIFSLTTDKYAADLNNLDSTYSKVYKDTFDMKRGLYNFSDVIVVLPGGSGTISEFFSFLEEARSNDNIKPIIVYDEDKIFERTVEATLNELIKRGFSSEELKKLYKVTHNKDEFTLEIENIMFRRRVR